MKHMMSTMNLVKRRRKKNEIFLFVFQAFDDNGEPKFPLESLLSLEEQVNRIRWIIPVLPDGELIKCLQTAACLARESTF